MRIGIDLMGGDQPPQAIFEAALQVSLEFPSSTTLVVFAQHSVFADLENQYRVFLEESVAHKAATIEFITTEQMIEKEDSPLLAVRRKKNSSMAAGMRLLKEGSLQAFVSTGNTGALIASAMFHLPMLPGIERPALLVVLPAGGKGVVVLDVGANISCTARHMLDYAKMGIIYRQCAQGVSHPKVGLLNIGTEQGKGNKIAKEAYQAFQEYFKNEPSSFLGNIEGRDVFKGKVDVLVTDGFTGNVFLKTCEGVTAFLIDYFQEQFSTQASFEVKKMIGKLNTQFNSSQQAGGLLCGVDGLVIKCHGYSDTLALINGIRGAYSLAKAKLIDKMKSHLADLN